MVRLLSLLELHHLPWPLSLSLSLSLQTTTVKKKNNVSTQIGESTRKEVQCVNQKHKPVEACGEKVEEEEEEEEVVCVFRDKKVNNHPHQREKQLYFLQSSR